MMVSSPIVSAVSHDLLLADLADEDRKRLEEVYVQGPGGTVAPRAWTGWRSGREFEDRRRKRGEEEVSRLV